MNEMDPEYPHEWVDDVRKLFTSIGEICDSWVNFHKEQQRKLEKVANTAKKLAKNTPLNVSDSKEWSKKRKFDSLDSPKRPGTGYSMFMAEWHKRNNENELPIQKKRFNLASSEWSKLSDEVILLTYIYFPIKCLGYSF